MPAKYLFDRADVTVAVYRVLLAGLLIGYPASQVMALWQAAQIINPGGFPDVAIITLAVLPMFFVVGSILLVIGFMTRFIAAALLLLMATVAIVDLLFNGAPGGALGDVSRLSVMIGLLVPVVTGGGRLSADGWKRARLVIRTAE